MWLIKPELGANRFLLPKHYKDHMPANAAQGKTHYPADLDGWKAAVLGVQCQRTFTDADIVFGTSNSISVLR